FLPVQATEAAGVSGAPSMFPLPPPPPLPVSWPLPPGAAAMPPAPGSVGGGLPVAASLLLPPPPPVPAEAPRSASATGDGAVPPLQPGAAAVPSPAVDAAAYAKVLDGCAHRVVPASALAVARAA